MIIHYNNYFLVKHYFCDYLLTFRIRLRIKTTICLPCDILEIVYDDHILRELGFNLNKFSFVLVTKNVDNIVSSFKLNIYEHGYFQLDLKKYKKLINLILNNFNVNSF